MCSATDSNRTASAKSAQRPLYQNHRTSSIRPAMSNFAVSMPKNRRNCLKTSTDQFRKIFVNKRLTMRRGAFILNRQGLLSRRAHRDLQQYTAGASFEASPCGTAPTPWPPPCIARILSAKTRTTRVVKTSTARSSDASEYRLFQILECRGKADFKIETESCHPSKTELDALIRIYCHSFPNVILIRVLTKCSEIHLRISTVKKIWTKSIKPFRLNPAMA